MKAKLVSFGHLEIDGESYRKDVVVDGGKIRKRDKGPSMAGYQKKGGHTPLTAAEEIPWGGKRLIVGTGAWGVGQRIDRSTGRSNTRDIGRRQVGRKEPAIGSSRVMYGTAAVLCVLLAASACTAAKVSVSPSPAGSTRTADHGKSQTAPAYCQDGPNAASQPADCVVPAPPTYRIVTARPSRDPRPPAPSAMPSAGSTPADSLSPEGTDYFSQTVPAGGSITVAVDFEGSTQGSLVGFVRGSGLSVTFRGKALKVEKSAALGDNVWGFSDTADNPANGDLVIHNPTGAAVAAAGYAYISTRRHLTLDLSTNFPHKGQQFTLNLSLTEAVPTDDVTVSIVDAAGHATPAAVTKTGTGRWTGTASVPATGEYEVRASTTGSRMRTATAAVTAGAGDVSLSDTFKERAEDPNKDGLIDQLILTPTITVAVGGKYVVRGTLYDEAGVVVGESGGDEKTLVAGAQPVDMSFDGKYIYKSGRWGPYTLHATVMHDMDTTTTIELDGAVLGQTAAYDYLQFEHERIDVIDESIKATAADTNGDGQFEEVRVTGTVVVETAGSYSIEAGLIVNDPWAEVAKETATAELHAGSNTFTVVLDGSDIAKAGRDGPYEVSPVSVDLDGSEVATFGMGWPNFKTPAYKASQFR